MHSFYIEQRDGVSILKINGRIDASNSSQIHEKIMEVIEEGRHKIIIDFSEVNYISSAGLRVLIYTSKAILKESGSFSICSVNKNVEKIFQISGLARMFNFHKNLESALLEIL